MNNLFPFVVEKYSWVLEVPSVSNYSLTEEHLGCFQSLTVTNRSLSRGIRGHSGQAHQAPGCLSDPCSECQHPSSARQALPTNTHTHNVPLCTASLDLQSKGCRLWQGQPPGTGYNKGTAGSWAPSDTSRTLRGDRLYPRAPPSGTWAGGTYCGLPPTPSPAPSKELTSPNGP